MSHAVMSLLWLGFAAFFGMAKMLGPEDQQVLHSVHFFGGMVLAMLHSIKGDTGDE